MDRSRKASESVPTAAAAILCTGAGTSGGQSGGFLLGSGVSDGLRAAMREELFISSSIMMDIICDSPDCNLIAFLNFFRQFPLLGFSGSLFRLFLLISRCFLMEALP